jgi:hypothetical protein
MATRYENGIERALRGIFGIEGGESSRRMDKTA